MLLWASLLATLSLAPSSPALADDAIHRKRGAFYEQGDWLQVTVGFRELFDKRLRQRLRSGFTTSVVMRIYLYEKSGAKPIAFSARTLRAVYDLWDEQYVLHLEAPHRTVTRRFKSEKQVVDRLSSLWRFPLVPRDRLEVGTQYFIGIIAEVNPMSDELLEEVRRWLRNPYSEHRQGSGESFFGSFVSIFVNKRIRTAERVFRLRTQPFFLRP